MSKQLLIQARVPDWVKAWWKSKAEELGCKHRGRASVARLMTAIAKGQYAIVKVSPEKDD